MEDPRFERAFAAFREAQSALRAEDSGAALVAVREAVSHAWPTVGPTAHGGRPPAPYPFDGLVYQLKLCVAESIESHGARTEQASLTDAVAVFSILAALLERESSMGA